HAHGFLDHLRRVGIPSLGCRSARRPQTLKLRLPGKHLSIRSSILKWLQPPGRRAFSKLPNGLRSWPKPNGTTPNGSSTESLQRTKQRKNCKFAECRSNLPLTYGAPRPVGYRIRMFELSSWHFEPAAVRTDDLNHRLIEEGPSRFRAAANTNRIR